MTDPILTGITVHSVTTPRYTAQVLERPPRVFRGLLCHQAA